MRFTKKFPINLSPKYLAMLMLGGASLFASCDKENEPPHDVELVFLENNLESKLDPRLEWEEFIKLVADPSVNNIYLCAHERGNYEASIPKNIANMRNYFHDRIYLAPHRIFGRGNLKFKPGVIPEADSLWL
ncbi:MAG: hypothetical protein K2L94_01820, partial [Alphaproteobacteria bacterium]|nr:hypothetical protein [Alphaproteobacteria bacterium]